MGGIVKTGVAAHDNACNAAETLRQSQIINSSTPAQVKAAEVAYFRTCRLSAIANGLSPSCFTAALVELQGTAT